MDSTSLPQQSKSVSSICRLCFTERNPQEVQLIFDGDGGYLSEWIEKLTSLKIINIPNAPASLCSNCKSTLEAFDSFREMCHTNDVVFKDTFGLEPENGDGKSETIEGVQDLNALIGYEEHTEQNGSCAAPTEILEVSDDEEQFENVDATMDLTIADNSLQVEDTASSKTNGGKYDCRICNRTESRMHILTHKAEGIYKCYMCDEEFNTYDMCWNHIKFHVMPQEQSSESTSNFCKICKKNTSKMHVMCHKAENVFVCRICKKTLNHVRYLTMHMAWHSKAQKNYVNDELLEVKVPASSDDDEEVQIIENDSSVQSVVSNEKEQDEVLYGFSGARSACMICHKSVSKLHMMTHKSNDLFVCYICPKEFIKYDLISKHVHDHLRKKKKAQEQNKDDSKKSKAPANKNDDDGMEANRDHTCPVCSKNVSNLHAIYHKPDGFKCPICYTAFKRFDCFGRHLRLHKGKSVCDVCKKSFTSASAMNEHRSLHFVK